MSSLPTVRVGLGVPRWCGVATPVLEGARMGRSIITAFDPLDHCVHHFRGTYCQDFFV